MEHHILLHDDVNNKVVSNNRFHNQKKVISTEYIANLFDYNGNSITVYLVFHMTS
jgi:hypothetical protein